MKVTACDICPAKTEEPYPRGWGALRRGADEVDICPACVQVLAKVLDELRKLRRPIEAAATSRQVQAGLRVVPK